MMAMEDLEVDTPVLLEEQKESSTTTASQRQQQPELGTAFGAAGEPGAGGRDANGREELLVDSEDLPNDEEEEEEDDDDYEEDQAQLIEDSQSMDEAVINILDDPMALSMALRNQYD